MPGGYLEDLCFDAHQACEKAIKADLIAHRLDFPYTHNLSYLLTTLESHGESLPDVVREAEELTHYATHTRYPALEEPVSESEYQEAAAAAEAVIRWAAERL